MKKCECVICASGGNFDSFYQGVHDTIQEFGLNVLGVMGHGEPTFSYTIGLHEKYGFELLVIGLPAKYAQSIFNRIALGYLAEGNILELDKPDDRWSNFPAIFKECNPVLAREYAVQAFQYYQTDVKIIQMVMSDRNGKLPHEPGFEEEYMSRFQRLLYK